MFLYFIFTDFNLIIYNFNCFYFQVVAKPSFLHFSSNILFLFYSALFQ